MSLSNRVAKIERNAPAADTVYFFGWSDCQWRQAEGLVRAEAETKEEFFERVRTVTDKKWIWCD